MYPDHEPSQAVAERLVQPGRRRRFSCISKSRAAVRTRTEHAQALSRRVCQQVRRSGYPQWTRTKLPHDSPYASRKAVGYSSFR